VSAPHARIRNLLRLAHDRRREIHAGDAPDEKRDIRLVHARSEAVEARANWWAQKVARMPADGLVIAKEAFRLVEQLQGYQGEEAASYLFHAFGTNLQFGDDEFNFVKARAEHGTKRAIELCRAHFEVPEP
jgi:hypothetical protein